MKTLSERKRNIILLAVLFLICVSFFFIPDTIFAHDTPFHIARIRGLAESIRHGEWLPAIFPEEYENYGYGLPMFYCDAFLYFPAVLNVLGVGLLWSYKIMMILLCFGAMAVSYYSVYKITSSDYSSFVFTALYIGSSYFASDFVERGAVGELFGYTIFPMALLGFYRSAYGDYKRNYPLIFGFLGACFSHNLSLVMYAVVFVAFIVLNIVRYFKEPKRILFLFLDAITVVLLAAVFLFPFVEQELNAEFYSYYVLREYNPAWAAIMIRNFFIQLIPSTAVYVPVLGLTMLIPFVLWLFSKKLSDGDSLIIMRNVCFILAAVCMFFCTGHFPYEKLDPLFNFIQFPWRWFMPVTMLLSFCACEIADELRGKCVARKKNVAVISVILILLCSAQYLFRAVPTFIKYYNANPETASHFLSSDESHVTIGDEIYLNKNITREGWREDRDGSAHAVNNDEDISLNWQWKYGEYRLDYSGYESGEGIEVPLTYYYGYHAENAEGNEVPVTPSYRGWLQIDPVNAEDTVVITYKKTSIQKISPLISLVSLIALITDRMRANIRVKKHA